MVAVLLGAATAVFQGPDLTAASAYLSGDVASSAGALAVASVMLWGLLLAGSVLAIVTTGRASLAHSGPRRRRWVLATALLACGLLLLAIGAFRHFSPAYNLCCGSVQGAHAVVR